MAHEFCRCAMLGLLIGIFFSLQDFSSPQCSCTFSSQPTCSPHFSRRNSPFQPSVRPPIRKCSEINGWSRSKTLASVNRVCLNSLKVTEINSNVRAFHINYCVHKIKIGRFLSTSGMSRSVRCSKVSMNYILSDKNG